MGNKFNDNTVKYQLKLSIKVDGVVSESDIVGAIFGLTEGLLEEGLELKQLQKSGRIGRIDFRMSSKEGRSRGTISIPSSLNKINSAILAATLETVERVGPCTCTIRLDKISDVRGEKRDQIKKRASEIMKMWNIESESDSKEISKFVEKDTQKGKVVIFGPDKLSAGSQIFKSQNIIIVEGRADVVNLMNFGIENTIALDGTKVPTTIKNLSKNRNVTAFLDGDKGGDFILKELVQTTEVDFVARAPFRTEVEDMSHKKVMQALDNKVPVKKAKFMTEDRTVLDFLGGDKSHGSRRSRDHERSPRQARQSHRDRPARVERSRDDRGERSDRRPRDDRRAKDDRQDSPDRRTSDDRPQRSDRSRSDRPPRREGSDRRGRHSDRERRPRGRRPDSRRRQVQIPAPIKALINKIKQTSTVMFLNQEHEPVVTAKTTEAFEELQKAEGIESIVIDGVITQRMLDEANKKSIKLIAGAVVGELTSRHKTPEIATFNRI